MAAKAGSTKAKHGGASRALAKAAPVAATRRSAHAAVLEEARKAGLLSGDKTEHVSFRAPPPCSKPRAARVA